jgi:N6-L-threonylcarbamoyladenine synthase
MLGGPYPGGQRIWEKALQGKPNSDVEFKRIFLSKDAFEFSFSWMKSQVSSFLKQLEKKWTPLTEELICDIAYEFQEAVVEVMVKKLVRAWIAFDAKTLWLAGGVSCNDRLWEYLNQQLEMIDDKLEMKWQEQKNMVCIRPMKKLYSMDNAAMIWLAGILEFTHN